MVGKPYEGAPHVRFEVAGDGDQDMGRLVRRYQMICVNGINRCKLDLQKGNMDADYTRTLRRTLERIS